jgi:hypothetical protein
MSCFSHSCGKLILVPLPPKRLLTTMLIHLLRSCTFCVFLLLAACSRQEPLNIFTAVAQEDTSYVKAWIRQGGNPDTRDIYGQTLLFIATGPKGGHSVLIALLEGGADPNLGVQRYTPLMNAANWVDLQAVRILLGHGANPNLRNADGRTALEVVSDNGGIERPVIEELQRVTLRKPSGPAAPRIKLD